MLNYLVLFIIYAVSVVLDAKSTVFALSKGGTESNPLCPDNPTFEKLVKPFIFVFAISSIVYGFAMYFEIIYFNRIFYMLFWCISIAKFFAATENYILGFFGQSPSSWLRKKLNITTAKGHFIFNAIYFGNEKGNK